MRVYELKLEYNHLGDMDQDVSFYPFEKINEFRFNIGGIEKVKEKEKIYLLGNFDIIPHNSDYPITDIGICVMSNKMINIIERHNLELNIIPVVIIDDTYLKDKFDEKNELKFNVPINMDYSIVQLLTYLDAFDYEKSVFKPLRSNPNMPGIIKKLVLREPGDGFPPIFKIKEKSSNLYVSEILKEEFEKNDIKGCLFEEIEVSNNSYTYTKNDIKVNKVYINWSDLTSILDALQTASGQTYGKKKLKELTDKLDDNQTIEIDKNGTKIEIKNKSELQNLINTYDPNIQLSQILD